MYSLIRVSVEGLWYLSEEYSHMHGYVMLWHLCDAVTLITALDNDFCRYMEGPVLANEIFLDSIRTACIKYRTLLHSVHFTMSLCAALAAA
jgi:hypothetical protein